MNLTAFFFMLASIISGIFALAIVILFICYLIIFQRVNKNFKAVDKK
ncbi:MAG: hypothetical protein ABF804_10405 [Liquorilactobacillus ghanensis]|nr:hypothetical protein [Liquorilactobacillus ghanensis]